MIMRENTIGAILAGGLSRRMEGQEKSLIALGEKPLISHAKDNLEKQIPDILLNANGEPERFSFLYLPVQKDTVEGFAGPLAGILAAMEWVLENRQDASHIITAAADTPFFPSNYVESMINQANEKNASIALAASSGRNHPVFGLWSISLADELRKFLVDEENRKVMLFVERYKYCILDFEMKDHDPFFNVNTPSDLAAAEKLMETS